MKHIGTKKIETDRLILRHCAVADAEFMYRDWASDPEVTKYLTWPTHTCVEDSKAILKEWVGDYEKNSFYCCCSVCDGRCSKCAGTCELQNFWTKSCVSCCNSRNHYFQLYR